MKLHTGSDADNGWVHGLAGKAANVHDLTQTHALPHGQEGDIFTDADYQSVDKREDTRHIGSHWHVALLPGKRLSLDKATVMGDLFNRLEKTQTAICAKVEHPLGALKRQFGDVKVSYRSLFKDTAQLATLMALANQ